MSDKELTDKEKKAAMILGNAAIAAIDGNFMKFESLDEAETVFEFHGGSYSGHKMRVCNPARKIELPKLHTQIPLAFDPDRLINTVGIETEIYSRKPNTNLYRLVRE